MIKIVPTTHLYSKETIEGIIKDFNPDVIGVELCETRFKALTGQVPVGKGDNSLIDNITTSIKEKAEQEGLDYGADMKTAMFYALNNNIPLLLVDKDIMKIKEELLTIPIEEQLFLQQELIKFQTENINQPVDEELVLKNLKENVPTMYKILIEGRNEYIANKIKEVIAKYPEKNIIIFLGKGHEHEVLRLVEVERYEI